MSKAHSFSFFFRTMSTRKEDDIIVWYDYTLQRTLTDGEIDHSASHNSWNGTSSSPSLPLQLRNHCRLTSLQFLSSSFLFIVIFPRSEWVREHAKVRQSDRSGVFEIVCQMKRQRSASSFLSPASDAVSAYSFRSLVRLSPSIQECSRIEETQRVSYKGPELTTLHSLDKEQIREWKRVTIKEGGGKGVASSKSTDNVLYRRSLDSCWSLPCGPDLVPVRYDEQRQVRNTSAHYAHCQSSIIICSNANEQRLKYRLKHLESPLSASPSQPHLLSTAPFFWH